MQPEARSDAGTVQGLGAAAPSVGGCPHGASRRAWLRGLAGVALGTRLTSGAAPAAPVVLVVGDSLSAEYGLKRGSGWVALLAQRLATERPGARVVNASISGDTTAGGRARLPAALKLNKPTHVVLELGANDALRGLSLASTRQNLVDMTLAGQAAGATVILVGMQVPPNYGREYNEEFAGLYATLAREHKTALVPFLLKGVADSPAAETLFQADRLHPNESAHPTILDNVWRVLGPLLR